jgi:hypothetical protein
VPNLIPLHTASHLLFVTLHAISDFANDFFLSKIISHILRIDFSQGGVNVADGRSRYSK